MLGPQFIRSAGDGDTTQRTTPGGLSTDASDNLSAAFVVETGLVVTRAESSSNHPLLGRTIKDNSATTQPPIEIAPFVVSTDGTEFTDLALECKHACGVAVNGSVYCWGYNNDGQLGDNSTTSSNVPVHVVLERPGGGH